MQIELPPMCLRTGNKTTETVPLHRDFSGQSRLLLHALKAALSRPDPWVCSAQRLGEVAGCAETCCKARTKVCKICAVEPFGRMSF